MGNRLQTESWTNERVEKIVSVFPRPHSGWPGLLWGLPLLTVPHLPHTWMKDFLDHQSTLGEPGPYIGMAQS